MPQCVRARRPLRARVRRLLGATLAVTAGVAALGAPTVAGPAAAVASAVTVSPASPVGGTDYATQTLGDAWDFDHPDDAPLVPGATTADLAGAAVRGGRLVVDARPGGWVAPLVSFDDMGALAWGRDGALVPVDADRYTRMSVHMRVDAAASGSVMWFTCGIALPSCQGQKSFTTTAGWRTYDIPLTTGAGGEPWAGDVKGLRFYPANPGGRAEIDWIRLYAPGGTATVSFADSSASAAHVLWDADADPANNTAGNAGWGRLDATGTGTTRTVQAGVLPQGTYRIAVVDDGRTTYAPTPLVVDGPPAPVVLDPDRTGGVDYATLTGNPWDFADHGDVLRIGNAEGTVAYGRLQARNSGPLVNDPHVILSQAGPIDGSRFHRLTVRMRHGGAFSLEDVPGAGMNSRIVWRVPTSPGVEQNSDDLVVLPGWHTSTLDLATSPPTAVNEPGIPGQRGWAGQQIHEVRIDPNEDRGPREWAIDDVRLAEDDTAYGGTFDVRFRDDAWQPGTTATVRADTDRAGCDGAVVARDVPVTRGVNVVRWAPQPVAAGTYWICVRLTDGRSATSAYATGPLQMTLRPSALVAGGGPFGAVDAVRRVPGGLQVSGWTIDPDTVGPVDVRVSAGGTVVPARASQHRPDVAAAHPAYGAAHGYAVTVPVTAGTVEVCVRALDTGAGPGTALGCRRVAVRSAPLGAVDRIRPVPGGVLVEGWALDPDVAAPVAVHAYAGRSGAATTARLRRSDIARAHPGYGSARGFSVVAPVTVGGRQPVCAYGINVGAGSTTALGCRDRHVRVSPWSGLDAVQRVPGGVRVRGWAIDPSTAASIDVHVRVGTAVTGIRADRPRPDLVRHFPGWAGRHGYDAVVPVPAAPTEVCAFAIDRGPGRHVLIGCRTV